MATPQTPSKPEPQTVSKLVLGWSRSGTPSTPKHPQPPPMRVILEGWFGQRVNEVTVDELMALDRKSRRSNRFG
jgi:hypothetical protein